jgi:hypothetical protein
LEEKGLPFVFLEKPPSHHRGDSSEHFGRPAFFISGFFFLEKRKIPDEKEKIADILL